ncbi:MAG: hypothetical protein IT385_05965 [Deltaproteobacteria bacterium]|nr:hypothetical protein [Deltaproteobacteria bacterium]
MMRLFLASALALAAACGDDAPHRDTSAETDAATDATEVSDTSEVLDSADATDATDAAPETSEVDDATDVGDATETTDAPATTDAEVDPGDGCHIETDSGPADTSTDTGPPPACDFAPDPADGGFDDHTIGRIDSVECFFAWAGPSAYDPVLVKFTVPDFFAADAPVRFYENGFYALHDEWYWFRLINGHAIPRLVNDPLAEPLAGGPSFATIAAIYAALSAATSLPLDLAWLGDHTRLYSKHYYDLAGFTTDPTITRFFGAGSLVHFAPHPDRRAPGEIWGFEMEFVERPTVATVERYFAHLARVVPAEIAERLVWIARSAFQDGVATQIKSGSGPLKDRVLTYDDLVVEGDVQVYNPGITAGVVHVMPETWSQADVKPDELVVLPRVPDDIPPTRAIVSAVPQTALAHVNLLAKSRGTPNVYIGGILQWGQLANWDYYRTPIILEATGDETTGAVRWHPMSPDDYNTYRSLITVPVRHVTQVEDLASAPYTVGLTEGGTADMAELVPLTGGKCAGFLSFLDVDGMETPDEPLCITIRAYVEHVAEFDAWWRSMVLHPDFEGSAQARLLLLEGREGFAEATAGDPAAQAWRVDFEARHQGDVLGLVLGRGGVKKMIRNKPLDPTTLATLRAALEARFGFLAPTQGLRFRSSATAEDVIGFNGAGLHDSNTGFFDPSVALDPDDRDKTIQWAIKKTWASYWNFNAFEERRAGRIDHFEGAMALAVHARFDDDKELANAVATHYLTTYTEVAQHRFVLNIQAGPNAVTNPGGSLARAEIDEVTQVGDEAPVIRRVQRSDLVDACTWLVSDEELLAMFERSKAHQAIWLEAENARRPAAEKNRTLVLDMELKRVDEGWPALASGEIRPARIIWRQSRVLDQPPAVRATPDPWLGAPFPITASMPQDLRTVAERVFVDACRADLFDIRVYKIRTPATVADLFPFQTVPYVYKAFVSYHGDAPGFDWPEVGYWLPRHAMTSVSAPPGEATRITLGGNVATTLDTDTITIEPDGSWRITRGDAVATGTCTPEQRSGHSSPAEFLRGLLPPP